jgi:hypothetical protein
MLIVVIRLQQGTGVHVLDERPEFAEGIVRAEKSLPADLAPELVEVYPRACRHVYGSSASGASGGYRRRSGRCPLSRHCSHWSAAHAAAAQVSF